MNIKESWLKNRFVNEIISPDTNLVDEITRLKKEKNAVIMAHYYQTGDIQDIADVVGDSLALAQWATKVDADVIVMCGVHFMGETVKILSPDKKVLIPDLNAGCSLAESCPADQFEAFVKAHPDHTVISYVNTSAAVKTLTDVVVTSSNARKIVDSFPKEAKLIFGPDRNLGNYINSVTGRSMLLWNGACHVHEQFSLEKIIQLKKEHPKALLLAHPECQSVILKVADEIGSTQALLNFTKTSSAKEFIVATESGIIHEMRKYSFDKLFIPAPPIDSSCGCNDCNFMKLNTMKKIYNCLKYEFPAIEIEESVRIKAERPIRRMLELS
jgi:quinolinate synthase